MKINLTVTVEKNVVLKAKQFAGRNKISLSKIIENHFEKLAQNPDEIKKELHPLVKKLAGIIPGNKKINVKNEYMEYLVKKHTEKKSK